MAKKRKYKNKKVSNEPKGIKLLWKLWNDEVIMPDENGNSVIMQEFTSLLFAILAWAMAIGSVLLFASSIYVAIAIIDWSIERLIGNIVSLLLIFVLCVLCFVISVIIKVMSNDVKREKDRHYILALFSGIISFVALIISLVSLF
ncbi:MAG: hypothetical protein IJ360_02675 [Clostridia bacterium]|nr:hypothetical protein [Clostridia bacterium]